VLQNCIAGRQFHVIFLRKINKLLHNLLADVVLRAANQNQSLAGGKRTYSNNGRPYNGLSNGAIN